MARCRFCGRSGLAVDYLERAAAKLCLRLTEGPGYGHVLLDVGGAVDLAALLISWICGGDGSRVDQVLERIAQRNAERALGGSSHG